jgi:hypothetical protein
MKYKYLILAVPVFIILLLLGILSYSTFADPAKFWYCSPTETRGDDLESWQKTITPAQVTEEPNEAIFENFTVSSDNDYFTVEHPYENPPDNPFTFELNEMTLGEPVEIDDGTLEFACIATAYHDANQTMSDDVVFCFYDSQLQPANVTDIVGSGNYASTESGSNFRYSPRPAVQVIFQYQQIEHLMFHDIKIFDTRTRKALTSGYSSSGRDGSHRFTTHVPIWHKTPVDLVIDVSYGPIKTFEFAPNAGEGFDEGNFKCRLISVLEGVNTLTSSSTTFVKTMIHKFKKGSPDKAGLAFFFACLPTAGQMPVTFEFLDRDGNKLSTRGSSTSGYTHNIRLKQPLEKIALIRAYYHTRRQRIVIHLPYIPGLPDENDAIENLFDVYVPYIKLHDPSQVEWFLRRTLQLSRSRSTGRTPANSINNAAFPIEFRGLTIRDIAKFYAQSGSLSIDIEHDQLNREYPVPLWVRFRQFLQKAFR